MRRIFTEVFDSGDVLAMRESGEVGAVERSQWVSEWGKGCYASKKGPRGPAWTVCVFYLDNVTLWKVRYERVCQYLHLHEKLCIEKHLPSFFTTHYKTTIPSFILYLESKIIIIDIIISISLILLLILVHGYIIIIIIIYICIYLHKHNRERVEREAGFDICVFSV